MIRGRDAGFTLLELLVAISVLGLLSVSVARGLHLGSEGWTRAHRQTQAAERLRDARKMLELLLAGATPQFAGSAPDDRRVAFSGGPAQVEMITRLPQAIGTPAMVAARVFRREDGALILAWRLDLPRADGSGALPENFAAIAPHVGALAFAYFGAPEGGGAAVWQDSWMDRQSVPLLVRVVVRDEEGRRALWPELVAEPRASAVSACLYDATDVECRRF